MPSATSQRVFLPSINELWRCRWLVSNLAARNLKARYRQSVLGLAWHIVSPLLTMTILTILFAGIMAASLQGRSFALYVITGLLPWSLFSAASSQGLVSITGSHSIIRKVYVPKIVFPLSAVLSSYVGFGLSLIPLAIIMIAVGARFSWALLFALIPTLEIALFSLGISMVLATAHVFFRDIRWFYDSALLAGFYITPIFYTPEVVGSEYMRFLKLNPLFPMIRAFRSPIVYGVMPDWSDLLAGAAASLIALLLGWTVVHNYDQRVLNHL
ncbi:MAG TPA: ABC transporter permease [Blastocatellia bacterium]|nr:ABC transporter permease [Blastocatellia bacterium]